ncbi:MAG: PspC domain-containing protein [Chloroflexi bacterium]|nr:PspC domain-containing protein [Chloroflexota bacterium]
MPRHPASSNTRARVPARPLATPKRYDRAHDGSHLVTQAAPPPEPNAPGTPPNDPAAADPFAPPPAPSALEPSAPAAAGAELPAPAPAPAPRPRRLRRSRRERVLGGVGGGVAEYFD